MGVSKLVRPPRKIISQLKSEGEAWDTSQYNPFFWMSSTINDWKSIRQAVGSAVFISYFVYYAVWAYARFKKHRKVLSNIEELGSKMYILGIAGLLSMNYAQAGILQTIMAFVVMAVTTSLFVASAMVDMIDDRVRCIFFMVFYSLNFAWYLVIIVDYFVASS